MLREETEALRQAQTVPTKRHSAAQRDTKSHSNSQQHRQSILD